MGGSVPNPVKVVKKVVSAPVNAVKSVAKAVYQPIGDAANQVVNVAGKAVGKVVGAIMPTPQIPEMPSAITEGSGDSNTASSNAAILERDRADRLRRRRGRAATQLVQPSIASVPEGSVATKSLLGQ